MPMTENREDAKVRSSSYIIIPNVQEKCSIKHPFCFFAPLRLCLTLFFIMITPSMAHADCTLAGTAVCDGVACPGKTFKAGQIIYNADHGVVQACLSDNTWKALHKPVPPDPCTTSGTPGTACADGQTVYAGSYNGNRYYTTKTDQSTDSYWGTHGVTLGAGVQDPDNGLANTNTALASIEGNPQAGFCNNSPYNPPACTPNAFVLCKNLRSTLGGDWYMPAYNETVNVLYANRAAIGGFSSDRYWVSYEFNGNVAYTLDFYDGTHWPVGKNTNTGNRTRCVKRG